MKILAFFIALAATAFYLLCYQQKSRRKILVFNIISRLLYITQYFILGAFEGVALEIAGAVAVMFAERKTHPFIKKYAWFFIIGIDIAIIASGLAVYKNWCSLLPIAGVLCHTSAMWLDDEKWIRRVSLCGNPFWFAYNFVSGAYGSCIGEVLSVISILTAMWRYDRKKKPEEITADKTEESQIG